jgi:MYND finger
MSSMEKASHESALETEEYHPAKGSWVAELEEAQAGLAELVNSGAGTAAAKQRRGVALQAHLRLCRAFKMLRQWEKLEKEAEKGLEVCASYDGAAATPGSGAAAAAKLATWNDRFLSYRALAGRALSVPSRLDNFFMMEDVNPNGVLSPHEVFSNSNVVQRAALEGDVRLMEAMVAKGAAIDYHFLRGPNFLEFPMVAPTDATALVAVCARLAAVALVRRVRPLPSQPAIDRSAECAMLLVHLGADATKTLDWTKAPDTDTSRKYRALGLDRLSAYEMAQRAGPRYQALVELMKRHIECSADERARMVHCRCGSRLPWKECHSTGVGRPPHHVEDALTLGGLYYRVSPLARCPCNNTELTHYECCWKDTTSPAYLADSSGLHVREVPLNVQPRVDEKRRMVTIHWHQAGIREDQMSFLKTSPGKLHEMFGEDGPPSQIATWDPAVYLGCMEKLDKAFVWRDLHWRLDKSELLRRTREWNEALEAYCDDAGLVGGDRERVVAQHTANPCAPCGRVGCQAFESEPKEFRRCLRCKSIAYCGRECQMMDWHQHRGHCSRFSDLFSEQLDFVLTTMSPADAAAVFLYGGWVRNANP